MIALSRANRPAEKPAAPAPAAPAPAAVAAPAPAPAPVAAAPAPAPRPAGPVAMAPKPAPKPPAQKLGFKLNEHIVYPAHGVGQIVQIEEKEVAGFKLELFVINFVKDKMILRVPTAKASTFGMRKLADAAIVKRALDTLTGRARIKRTMWSRRAQEYEAKINSGDLVSIAEVVRDLYRSEAQPEQSYSERQLYEAALDRIAREIAAVQKLTETEALKVIEGQLQKGPKRGAKAEAETEATAEGEAESETGEIETGVDEAA
ncbi:MAG: CarD family transcriptional regulator [Methylobacteriaceae bacterium]|nr:CarD family transcriptional regulator [Methylobacteriaceae bacterium]